MTKAYPECSGNSASCPENEGYGCCKPNSNASIPALIEPVARAICRASGTDPNQPVYRNGKPESEVLYLKWKLYREEARAAIMECRVEEMAEALELLCEAKDLKETYGDCSAYREVKERGWAKVRELLARFDKPTTRTDTE